MSDMYWDLDGLISKEDFKDIDDNFNLLNSFTLFEDYYYYLKSLSDKEKELFKKCGSLYYATNPFYLHTDRLFDTFKRTEKYHRFVALSLSEIEFTTNIDIFNSMGIARILLNENNILIEGSSDILVYFNYPIKNLHDSTTSNVFLLINSLGNKILGDDDNMSLINILNDNDLYNISFVNVTKDEVLKHIGVT